jgi:hypothetical protein
MMFTGPRSWWDGRALVAEANGGQPAAVTSRGLLTFSLCGWTRHAAQQWL